MGNDARLNFISSILITAVSVTILFMSYGIYRSAEQPLHTSPALMPGMLGMALLIASVLLFVQSIKGVGVATRTGEAKAWALSVWRQPATRDTIIGIGIMAVYTLVLLKVMPFWAASLIFTIAMLAFLRAAAWWKILLISGSLVGAIVLLFAVVFSIPLP